MGKETRGKIKMGTGEGVQRHLQREDRKVVCETDRKGERWRQVWQETRGLSETRKCHVPWSCSPVTVRDALILQSGTRSG